MTNQLTYSNVVAGLKVGAAFARQKWPFGTSVRLRSGIISSSKYQTLEGLTFRGVSLKLFEIHQKDSPAVMPRIEMVDHEGNSFDYLPDMVDQFACDWFRVEN